MLVWCHEREVLHGDFKLENIMFTMNGYLKLIDFGYAVPILPESESTYLTRITGTPSYSAPEMITSRFKGPASDWFALGTCMFELLTGEYLFEGNDGDSGDVSSEIVSGSLSKLHKVGLPPHVEELLHKFLAYDIKDRWGRTNFYQISNSPVFRRIDWERLIKQRDKIELYEEETDD